MKRSVQRAATHLHGRSMRHEYREVGLLEHRSGRAAEDRLHQPRVAIGAKHNEVRANFRRAIVNTLPDLPSAAWELGHPDLATVMAQPRGQISAGVCSVPVLRADRIKACYDNFLGLFKIGHCDAHGA